MIGTVPGGESRPAPLRQMPPRQKTFVSNSKPPVAVMPAGNPDRVILAVRNENGGWTVLGSTGRDGVIKPPPSCFSLDPSVEAHLNYLIGDK